VWSHDLTDIFHSILGAICLAKSDSLSEHFAFSMQNVFILYFCQTVYHRSVIICHTVVDPNREQHHKMFVFFSFVVGLVQALSCEAIIENV
jgi:hypothetical protein